MQVIQVHCNGAFLPLLHFLIAHSFRPLDTHQRGLGGDTCTVCCTSRIMTAQWRQSRHRYPINCSLLTGGVVVNGEKKPDEEYRYHRVR